MPATPDKLTKGKDHGFKAIAFAVARVPNSQRLFLGSSDFKVYELDLAEAKIEPKELGTHQSYVTGVALAGKHLVTGGYDGRLIWWDVEKKSQVRAVDAAHQKWIRKVVASPDGKLVASVADDMVCKVWEAESGKLVHELKGHKEKTPNHFPSMLFVCCFSPDGKHLATADKVGHLVVWDVASGKQVTACEAPGMYTWDPTQRIHSIGGVRGLAFSADGQLLAAGGIDKIGNIDHLDGKARIEVFDWQKQTKTHEFLHDKNKGLVEKLAFHPQGDWLVAAGGAGDGFLLFHDLKNKKVLRAEKAPMHVHDVALSETGETLFAVGHNKVVAYEMKG
jgi:WD40 repeat protein